MWNFSIISLQRMRQNSQPMSIVNWIKRLNIIHQQNNGIIMNIALLFCLEMIKIR